MSNWYRCFFILPIPIVSCGFVMYVFFSLFFLQAYKDYTDYYNPDKVHFEITMAYQQIKSAKQEEWFLNKFKLKTTLSTFNMYLLDEDGLLRKYTTPEESKYPLTKD